MIRLYRYSWLKHICKWGIWTHQEKESVCLTFDDGPHPISTPVILDLLKKWDIKATFFCVGENVIKYPEIFTRILEEGHGIGNHTNQHENAWRTTHTHYLNSIDNFPYATSLFRPPYGRLSSQLIRKIKERGFDIIMWSWLSGDYNPKLSNEKIIAASRNIKGGDILVFHDSDKTQFRIQGLLEEIIPALLAKQFTFRIFVKG